MKIQAAKIFQPKSIFTKQSPDKLHKRRRGLSVHHDLGLIATSLCPCLQFKVNELDRLA